MIVAIHMARLIPVEMGVVMAKCPAVAVGTTLRAKRRRDFPHFSAQLLQHACQHLVPAQPQRIRQNFTRGMPIANVPGDTGQVFRAHLDQRLRRGLHCHLAAPFQHQRVSIVKRRGFRKVHQDICPRGR